MNNSNSISALLDRHFKMNQDYSIDLVKDLFDQEKVTEYSIFGLIYYSTLSYSKCGSNLSQ